jgi:hypothetical protein
MSESPWTTAVPEPGDFDHELLAIDPRYVERHRGTAVAALRIIVSVESRICRSAGVGPTLPPSRYV